jgi:epoxyqueuosine reductase
MDETNLVKYLKSLGASLVGFADLSSIDASMRSSMPYGISIAIKIPVEVIDGISDGPTETYYEEYKRINKVLDHIAMQCVKYIEDKGYKAIGQTSTYVTSDNDMSTALPHKTAATRAGLGWIGKSALLVTPEYGPAVRIITVLTDMPLKADSPIDKSRCGSCTKCHEACPAEAIKGALWDVNTERESLIDVHKCRQKARELMNKAVGIETSICGKCIEVCPVRQRVK